MSTDVASLNIEVDSSGVIKATKNLNKLGKQSDKSETKNQKLKKSFSGLGTAIGALGLGALFASAIKTAASFETMAVSLETVTGSSEKAVSAMAGITEFAKNTPFQVSEITDAFIKLKALGIAPTEENLRSFGNTSSAMGKSLNQMIEAVADAATGEFERLKEFGIKSKSQGENVTFTFQGVSKTVKKSSKEITGYLEDIGRTKFAGAMSKQMETINGKISVLGDSLDSLSVKFLQGNAGGKGLLDLAIDSVNYLTEGLTTVNGVMVFAMGNIDKFFTSVSASAERFKANVAVLWTDRDTNIAVAKAIDEREKRELLAIDNTVNAYIEGEAKKAEAKGSIKDAGAETTKKDNVIAVDFAAQDEKDLDRLRTKYASEYDLLQEKYAAERELLAEKLAADAQFKNEYDRLIFSSKEQQAKEELTLTEKTEKAKLAIKEKQTKIAINIADNLAVLMTSKNKEMFEIGKIAATASAIINTYEGATKALAQGGFFGIAMAGSVIIAGMSQVASIQSQSFNGGGSVSSAGAIGGGGAQSGFSGGGQLAGVVPFPEEKSKNVYVTLNGEGFSRNGVRDLIDSISEELGDGLTFTTV